MRAISDFTAGLTAHLAGVRHALAHTSLLVLSLLPFGLTILLYVVGFTVFAAHGQAMLALVWSPEAATTTGVVGALYWLYANVLKYLLYALVFVLMYFLFMVVANIIASPLYDHIAGRMDRELDGAGGPVRSLSILGVVAEEAKKALFVVAAPLILMFIPVIGQILAPAAAMIVLAWDFLDFSLSRKNPDFRSRLTFARKNLPLLLGFGLPLCIPVLNIALYPFAIIGATLLAHRAGTGQTPG